jgi:serine phosphatase RsbU (regulator of sigma subunit)
MKRIFLFVLLFLSVKDISAQLNKYGVPSIINYGTQVTNGAEYNWSIVKDNSGVVYFGNDGKGIIRFDGHKWSVIPVRNEALIRAIIVARDGVIYAGGAYEFGFVQPEKDGTLKYVSISSRFDKPAADTISAGNKNPDQSKGKVSLGQIYSIALRGSLIYFVSFESLFIYDPATDNVEYVNLRNYGLKQVINLVNINNRLIMADNIQGLFEIKDNKPVRIPGGEFFGMKMVRVILPDKDDNIFIGTVAHGCFLFDLTSGKVSTNVLETSLNEKLKTSQLYTAINLNSGEKLLGTLRDGIFVLDKNRNLIGKWDTKSTGMADNTITAFYIDGDKGSELWFSTFGYVSKAYVGLPFNEISASAGYEGGLNSIADFEGKVYLSSDLGLFSSYVNDEGETAFKKVGNYLEVFPLYVGQSGNEKFLLVGTKMGLYQISRDGRIIKVDDSMKYPKGSIRGAFSIRSLLQSSVNPKKFYIGLDSYGLVITEYNGKDWTYIRQIKTVLKGNVTNLFEDEKGDLFIYTGNPSGVFRLSPADTIPTEFTLRDGLPEASVNGISKINNEIVICTGKGLYRYRNDSGKWSPANELTGGYSKDISCKDIYQDKDGDIWMTTQEDKVHEMLFQKDSTGIKCYKGPLSPMPSIEKGDFKYFDNRYWMTKSKSVYIIDKEKMFYPPPETGALLTKIVVGADSLMMNTTFFRTLPDGKNVISADNRAKPVPQIRFNYNSVSFSWTMPYFVDDESTLFRYRLDGFDKGWSKWEKLYYKDFTYLPFGKYTFRIKARTATGIESKEALYEFNILKPWYFTTLMIILYFIGFVALIIVIIMAYTRKLKNENIRLEGIVAERTAVVVKQKEELESSIHYASRIQMALLPSEAILSQNLKNYFILFKPRDIVSGDFYWMTKKGNRLYIVAGDCTGHGVPGAFMSLLGMSFLDEIIDKEASPRADHILSELRLHVTESLKQSGGDDEAKDGMDMALLVIDFNVSRIEFSGAYNPCFRVRKMTETESKNFHDDNMEMADGSMSNGKYLLETIFASKMPIGISSRMDEKFVFYDWVLEKGVSYYLFSDGYIDQFGGEHGRKFMKKNFKSLILDVQDYPLNKQRELLDQNLKDWMGHTPQIDDILVMGLRID